MNLKWKCPGHQNIISKEYFGDSTTMRETAFTCMSCFSDNGSNSTFLLYLRTQNALSNMHHSPTPSHSYKHFFTIEHSHSDGCRIKPQPFWLVDVLLYVLSYSHPMSMQCSHSRDKTTTGIILLWIKSWSTSLTSLHDWKESCNFTGNTKPHV